MNHALHRMARAQLTLAAFTAVAGLISSARGGQVVVDNTLGHGGALSGPGFAVPATLGKQVGANLFHSFSAFNLDAGETASFAASTATRNILARVTGGAASTINGTIATRFDNSLSTPHPATFYLINPSGVVFGPNAALDTAGSFVVTTADAIKLADGGVFHASTPASSVLTSAAPSAFGFLSRAPAPVAISGQVSSGVAGTPAILSVASGQSISVVAGRVQISNGALIAPAGSVNIAAIASVGDVPLSSAGVPDVSGISSLADVSLVGSAISVSGDAPGSAGGGITLRAAGLSLDAGSVIVSLNSAGVPGNAVDIHLGGALSLTGGSNISVAATGAGDAGPLNVVAATITIGSVSSDSSALRSQNGAGVTADASPMTVQAGNIQLLGVGGITSSTAGAAAAADINVSATTLGITGGGGIDSLTNGAGATGRSGNVSVAASQMTLDGLSRIASITLGPGQGGSVTVSGNSLKVSGGAAVFGGTGDAGNSGDVFVSVDDISLTGTSSTIQASSTNGTGKAGNVTINCKTLSLTGGATVSILSNNDVGGGDLRVTADAITLSDPGTALSDAPLFGSGGGGSIRIQAGTLDLENGAGILTEAFGFTAGGPIVVNAGQVMVRGGSHLSADSGFLGSGTGNAGSITLSAQSLLVDGPGSSITSETDGAGSGGAITLTAPKISLTNGASISASTSGTGSGGTINVTTTNIDLRGGSNLFAFTDGPGDAGNIEVTAKTFVASDPRSGIRSPTIVFDGDGRSGNGGDISVTTGLLTLENGATFLASAAATTADGTLDLTNTTDVTGHAGRIVVTANRVNLRGSSEGFASGISARTTVAAAGTGAGGGIAVAAKQLRIEDGAQLDTSTTGSADGGAILLLTGSTRVAGAGTHVQSAASGTGNAGGIVAGATNDFVLSQGARVVVSAERSTGGDVAIRAGRRLTLSRGFVGASSSGAGGNIFLRAGELIELRNSTVTARAGADGGRIHLDPPAVVLDHSVIDGRAGGTPVQVTIQSAGFLSADSRILTNTGIVFPEADIAGSLVELPNALVTGATQLVPQCGVRYSQDAISSFVTTGRGGNPPEPGGWSPALELDLDYVR